MELSEISDRVDAVRGRIDAARSRAGRTDPVTLVAVTKTYPAALVGAAVRAGVRDVGENRVQELDAKVGEVGRDAVRWHLIGHLQRNKAKRAVELCDVLHSLDSARLAATLSQAAEAAGTRLPALVQVNVSGEGTKGGFEAEQLVDEVGAIAALPGLRLEGLMTMAPLDADERALRRVFGAARRLLEETARQVPGFVPAQLSMGMSNDYEIAVEEGSTLVRIGSALFGERHT